MRGLVAILVLGLAACIPSRESPDVLDVDWRSVATSLEAHAEGFDTYVLQRGSAVWVAATLDEIAEGSQEEEIAHLIMAVSEEMEPWEKETPIQDLRDRLSELEGLELYILISRTEPYTGYYLALSPTGTFPH